MHKFNFDNVPLFNVTEGHSNKEIYRQLTSANEYVLIVSGFSIKDKSEVNPQVVIGFTSNYNCIKNGTIAQPYSIYDTLFINKNLLTQSQLFLAYDGEEDSYGLFTFNFHFIKNHLFLELHRDHNSYDFYLVCKKKVVNSNDFYYSLKTVNEIDPW